MCVWVQLNVPSGFTAHLWWPTLHIERDVFVSHSSWVAGWACVPANVTWHGCSYLQHPCIEIYFLLEIHTIKYHIWIVPFCSSRAKSTRHLTGWKNTITSSPGTQFGSTFCPGHSGPRASLRMTRQHYRRQFYSCDSCDIVFNRCWDWKRRKQIH